MVERFFVQDLPEVNARISAAAYTEAVGKLIRSGMTVSVAESCTGGLIGKLITDVSGASAVFAGGMITYQNRIKIEKLGVSAATVAEHSEVSFPCAAEMAACARAFFETDFGLSATGYAGPTGGTAEDPVGTVYMGLAYHGKTEVYRLSFGPRSRDDIRMGVALFAADLLSHRLP